MSKVIELLNADAIRALAERITHLEQAQGSVKRWREKYYEENAKRRELMAQTKRLLEEKAKAWGVGNVRLG